MKKSYSIVKGVALGAILAIGCSGTIKNTKKNGLESDIQQLSSFVKLNDKKVRTKLNYIKHVKNYGHTQFGLPKNPHYTKYIGKQRGKKTTLYILNVTDKFYIPANISGKFIHIPKNMKYRKPVKKAAYFQSNLDKMVDETIFYKTKGKDTYWRSTTNFNSGTSRGSPITDTFLKPKKERQTRTVLHETWHYTASKWFKGKLNWELDESIAQLVGYAGSLEYFKKNQGVNSKSYKQAFKDLKYYKFYSVIINSAHKKLTNLYNNTSLTAKQKSEQRKNIFAYVEKKTYGKNINNAYLWDSFPYTKHFPTMLKLYRAQGNDLKKTITSIKKCPPDEKKGLACIKKLTLNSQVAKIPALDFTVPIFIADPNKEVNYYID